MRLNLIRYIILGGLVLLMGCSEKQNNRCGPDPKIWQVNRPMPELFQFFHVEILKNGGIKYNKFDVSENELKNLLQNVDVFLKSNDYSSHTIVLSNYNEIECKKLNKIIQIIEDNIDCTKTICAMNPTEYFSFYDQKIEALS
jgi:hypothetical protein